MLKKITKRFNNDNRGSIMLVAIFLFLLMNILLLNLLHAAYIENRIAENVYASEQSWQAVEAGIEWARVEGFKILSQKSHEKELPQTMLENTPDIYMESELQNVGFKINASGLALCEQKENVCSYEFICQGWCGQAQSFARIRLQFGFQELYGEKENESQFILRTFQDKGKINYCEFLLRGCLE
jgi:hypothetical protein